MGSPQTPPSRADRSLPLCEVLEQEYAAITGDAPDAAEPWKFTPEQILEPERLAGRLTDAHDRATQQLTKNELKGLLERLGVPSVARDRGTLQDVLADGFNAILENKDFYDRAKPKRFEGVRFRSQTLDCLEGSDIAQRNRLILEDTFPELQKVYDIRLERVYRKIHRQKFGALCLSGGGIRSATFALGVVQGLARNGLLGAFHYLSTVSGGGYLGAWLSAWIKHTNLPHVIAQLRLPTGRPLEPEPAPIWHLRTYSNYMSPKLGALSADSWTLIATYLRNLFLTWLVLLPPLVGVLTLPLLLGAIVRWAPSEDGLRLQAWLGGVLALGAFAGGVLAVRYVHANRPISSDATEGAGLRDSKRDQRTFLRWCLLPLVAAVLGATVCWAWASRHVAVLPLPVPLPLGFAVIGAFVHLAGWLLTGTSRHAGEGLVIVLTGFVAGLAAWLAARAVPLLFEQTLGPAIYVCLAVPFLLILILVFSHIYVGYTSGQQVDASREWSARFGAWVLIVAVAWVSGFALVILGPVAAHWAFQYLQERGEGVLLAGKTVVGALGVISGAVTLRVGHGAATPGSAGSRGAPMNLALAVAAPTFVAFLIVLLGWVGSLLIDAAQNWMGPMVASAGSGSGASIGVTAAVTVLLIVFGVLTASRVDTNKFSLHAMYRARLIRAYLGASRPAGERDPNRFTGFDDADNARMRDIWPRPHVATSEPGHRPMHVVNVALNLVGGSNLAWQERKAESFTFSPLHCGAYNHGYRRTWDAAATPPAGYAGTFGVSLGTAMTISGAAASPNMGYHSSPVISLLLTLFDIRLGWWLGNPGHAGRDVYHRSAPTSSLRPILDEALGRTDDKNPYVYLSDGGHFENLGLYEMVLRRCHTIVVSDAGCDPGCSFEDLGNAIRKIRIDFGIPIELQDVPIYPRVGIGPAQCGKYGAIGTIRYSHVDAGAEDGTLIYLKPAFYGCEPMDVVNYAKTSPTFPHESTVDQFFSESQFESYRALGSHVIDQIFALATPATDSPPQPSLAWLVQQTTAYLRRPVGMPGQGVAP